MSHFLNVLLTVFTVSTVAGAGLAIGASAVLGYLGLLGRFFK